MMSKPILPRLRSSLGVLLVFKAIVVASPLTAAEATDTTASSAPSADSSTLSAIVVTANKRSQSIQDVGVTVDVLSGQQLADRNIVSLADIAEATPGLSYASSNNNTPVYTLRGIGFNEASLAAYPSVSVYMDEAPLAFPVLSSQGAFDLQRIEVLKGPQGILYGENSTGGAINYIAAKPTDTFSAGEEVGYGNYNTFEFNGFISGPVTDTLKARFAAHFINGDDWQYSYTRNDTLGKVDVHAARLILDWTPVDALRFSLDINGWQDQSDPEAGQLVAVVSQQPAYAYPAVVNYPFAPQNNRAADWRPDGLLNPSGQITNDRPASDRRQYQIALRTDFDVTNSVTLTSISSFVNYNQTQVINYDGVSVDDDNIPQNDGHIDTVYQELRISNGNQAGFRWLAGTNYQNSSIQEDDTISFADGSTHNPMLDYLFQNGYDTESHRRDYAFFGNTEYDATDALTVLAGARYTDNLLGVRTCNFDLGDGHADALFTTLGTLLSGTPVAPLVPGDCFSLNFNKLPGEAYTYTLNQHNVSWHVGTNYKLNSDTLLYANISKGFKAGSSPTVSGSSWTQDIPVKQESVLAYEGGIKFSQWEHRLAVTGAVFYYDYRDKQILGKEDDPVFGVLNALVNVPKSHIEGAELSVNVQPFSGFTVNGALTYVDSRIDSYVGGNVLGSTQNFAGATIPFSPKWNGAVGAEYKWHMNSMTPFLSGDADWRTKTTSVIGGEDITIPASPTNRTASYATYPFLIDGYALVNLQGGVNWGDNKWRLMFWGKNVLNKYYWQNSILGFDTVYRLAGRPATYGVTIAYKY